VLPGRQPFLTSAPSAPTAGLRRRRRNTSQLGEQFHGYASLPAPTAALSDGHASPGCGCRWVGFLFVDLPWEGLAAFRAGQLDTWMMRRCFRSLRIVLNAITFQRTWQIPPPPTGLCLSGRGLLSSATCEEQARPCVELASDRRIRRNASQVGEQFHGYASLPATTAGLSDGHASPGCCRRCGRNSSLNSTWEGSAACPAGKLDSG
jgi:hypothetical protein